MPSTRLTYVRRTDPPSEEDLKMEMLGCMLDDG
jgi:hypothetical protein